MAAYSDLFNTTHVLAVACTFLLLALPSLLLLLLRRKLPSSASSSSHQPRLPPGSMGLPLLGESLEFAFQNTCRIGNAPPFYTMRHKRYGSKVFKTHLLGRPAVVSMDPELNKLLMNNERLANVFWPKQVDMVLGPVPSHQGELHRQQRDFATASLSPLAIQAHHVNAIQQFAISLLDSWQHMKLSVDAQHQCKLFIFAYSVKINLGLEFNDPLIPVLLRDYSLLSPAYSSIPINFPGTTLFKALKARQRIIRTLRDQVKLRKSSDAERRPVNSLDMILKRKDRLTGEPCSEELVTEYIFGFLLGSFDTTSTLLILIIKFLSENPHVLDELRREHFDIRGSKTEQDLLSWDDFKNMSFTDNVIKEALRLGNVVHLLPRESLQDIIFKDLVIPKGWMIIMNFAMVHLNQEYFPNPFKFDPWRWKDTTINNPTYLVPFGGGYRSCLGSTLAKFQASIFIHYLVTRYRWSRVCGRDDPIDEANSFNLITLRSGLYLYVQQWSP